MIRERLALNISARLIPSTLRAIAGMLLLLCLPAFAGEDVSVTASPTKARGGAYAVDFRLKNIGAAPLTFKRRQLPWAQSATSGLVVVAISRAKGGSPLPSGRSLHNPVGEVTLQQGQSVEGSLELERVIPDLRSALQDGEVVVHWTYFPQAGDVALPSHSGWFSLKPERTK